MSSTQCKAVIILIHKSTELPWNEWKNWWPISLTNSNYELLAKCIALRLSSVIDDLVNSISDQVGYIKGRRVSTLRLIDDNYYWSTKCIKWTGIVSYDWLFSCFWLHFKGFYDKCFSEIRYCCRHWVMVCVLIKDTKSRVSYCGWLSDILQQNLEFGRGAPFTL